MVSSVGVVALDVPVEVQVDRFRMECRKVVSLPEGVHGQLPVASHVVVVPSEIRQLAEVPRDQLGPKLRPQLLLEIDGAFRVGMDPQQAGLFHGG